jgi:RHH-type proline utilization regulon transcriptional repressor/proline dehydrogenase/delta 1-pyrroline-5-carboxylate dehydrogenase
MPADQIASDPVEQIEALQSIPHPRIPLPRSLFGDERVNSTGVNFADGAELAELVRDCAPAAGTYWSARPRIDGRDQDGAESFITNPANRNVTIGSVVAADGKTADAAIAAAWAAQPEWNRAAGDRRHPGVPPILRDSPRSDCLPCEAGKTLPTASRNCGSGGFLR